MNGRAHGQPPYKAVVVHGGPGAPGSAVQIAAGLADYGALEPFQSAMSVDGQIEELASVVRKEAEPPVVLIGHSWGAMLGYLVAARHPNLVSKLILVCSGGFTAESYELTRQTRMSRLSDAERERAKKLRSQLKAKPGGRVKGPLQEYYELISKADAYDPDPEAEDGCVGLQNDVNKKVWAEAVELRESGELLAAGKHITCPVVALHGDHDPHPASAVENPLREVVNDFKMVMIPKCGHDPWKERQAKDEFFCLLIAELDAG